MLLRRGKMVSSHSLHIGTLRLDEQMREAGASKNYLQEYLESIYERQCDLMADDLPLESVKSFIVIGADAASRRVLRLGKKLRTLLPPRKRSLQSPSRSRFQAFHRGMHRDPTTFPGAEAEGLSSGLAIESLFLARTGAELVIVPNVSIREGLLLAEVRGLDPVVEEELKRQVIASAKHLGSATGTTKRTQKRKRAQPRHFRRACDGTRLSRHERLLLETAAILHDIGTYIRSSGHHRHGEYIVSNSEIYGLNRSDVNIISNVVRYHRRNPPAGDRTSITFPCRARIGSR